MLYSICRLILLVLFKLLFRLQTIGSDFIPRKGAFIIASNHLSNLDPIVVGIASPRRLSFLAKEELFQLPILSQLLPLLDVVPLRRNRADIFALKAGIKKLKQNCALALFPEGTRLLEGKKVYPGVGFLVSKTGVPVLPAKIYNTDKVLSPGKIIPALKKVKIIVGKPLLFDRNKKPEIIAQEVLAHIHSL